MRAKRNESGMASATMRAARQLPNRRSRTTTTSTAPSKRLCFTVSIVRSTTSLRAYWMRISRSAGSFLPSSLSFSSTRLLMMRLFSPTSIITVPSTASSPFSTAHPVRTLLPMLTSARSFTRSGSMPAANFTGRLAMSSALATLLTPRINTRSVPRSMTPPPALSTFWPMISASSLKVMPAFASDSGFGKITNCRS